MSVTTNPIDTDGTPPNNAGTYTFDRLAFLTGNNLGADQAAYSNLEVTFTPGGGGSDGFAAPEPSTLMLVTLSAFAVSCRRPRRGNR
jgi:hypothetical protein